MAMTRRSNSDEASITGAKAIKFIKSAADDLWSRVRWLDLQAIYDASFDEKAELKVAQLNEDLEWLCRKLSKAQKYERTPEIAKFEKKLLTRVIKLNRYVAGFENAIEHFHGLREAFDAFSVDADAKAIRKAKRKWGKLEKKILKKHRGGNCAIEIVPRMKASIYSTNRRTAPSSQKP
jgi:hypothetical protein